MRMFRLAHRSALASTLVAAVAGALVVSCVSEQRTQDDSSPKATTAPAQIGFLAFGDTGYDYAFLDPEDRTQVLTREQFVEHWREEWIEDRRPIEDFALPAMHRLPSSGGFVNATGLPAVAAAMRTYCLRTDCAFATMLGDNIYPEGATAGEDGIDDAERFRTLFVQPFGSLAHGRAGFRIYATLGNHDWKTSRAGVTSQLRFHETTPPFYMNGLFYKISPPAAHGSVDLFVIDTHMLLAGTPVHKAALGVDGSELPSDKLEKPEPWAVPQNEAERAMAQWLEAALRTSTAQWKIVIGHHPLWSSAGSKFEQARALRALIVPTLCRYADMYIAGHEHTLELHLDDCAASSGSMQRGPLLQIVSGAGSKQRPVNRAFMRMQDQNYAQLHTLWVKGLVWGFAHVTLEGERATVRMITTPDDESGKPVEEFVYTYSRRSGGATEEKRT